MRHYHFPKALGNSPKAEVYVALNDPYSFMLIQALSSLELRFDIRFKLFLIYEHIPGLNVDMDVLREWSIKDANYIAKQYRLSEIAAYPTQKTLITGQQAWQLEVKNVKTASAIFHKVWFDKFDEHYGASTPVINFQINNQLRMVRKGHYAPASIFFCGDWFVGVDRLTHFEERLQSLALHRSGELHEFEKNRLLLPVHSNTQKAQDKIEVFISLRSPFSYIGFVKAHKLAQHYGLPLKIKLILPMKMRGMSIPANKQRYMFLDACREAAKLDIPLTSFTDPQVQGIINCYQLFTYAQQQNKSYELIIQAYEAIFVHGIDLSQLSNIKALCKNIDLDFETAHALAKEHDWQKMVEENLATLEGMNFWGVPCFRYQEVACWGQDRLAQIENAIMNAHE